MNIDQYRDALMALLPRGRAWPRDPDSDLGNVMLAFAAECQRSEQRAEQLLKEMDARSTIELLAEWAREWALPDDCISAVLTDGQLRNQLIAKITTDGTQSKQYFIDLAATLGYAITITEYDQNHPGDSGYSGDQWNFVWQVNAPATEITELHVGTARAGQQLRNWGDPVLECFLRQRVHAHRVLLFANGS